MTSGNVTYVMDNLCELGLVERERSAADRRVTHARLTPKGEALIDRMFPRHAKEVFELSSVLSPDEQDLLRSLLKSWVARVGYRTIPRSSHGPDRCKCLPPMGKSATRRQSRSLAPDGETL